MKFTDTLWESIDSSVYPAILDHPFLQGLTSGALEEAAFRHYVEQDSLYLREFGRGLAMIAAKAAEADDFITFCDHAKNTLIVERALHAGFIDHWKAEDSAPEMSPTTTMYTGYLLRVAHEGTYAETLAAFLPCYWIYRRVGLELVKQGSPNPLYQRWIDTYSGEEFGQVVEEMLGIVNRAAESASASERANMLRHFQRTSQLEWMFWDMGYRRETWGMRP